MAATGRLGRFRFGKSELSWPRSTSCSVNWEGFDVRSSHPSRLAITTKPCCFLQSASFYARRIAMTDTARREIPPIRTVPDLLDALRANDAERNARAIELCGQLSPSHVSHTLVLQLANRRLRPAHRIRLAKALERVGSLSDPADHFTLMTFFGLEKNPEVRAAIGWTLAAIRYRQMQASS